MTEDVLVLLVNTQTMTKYCLLKSKEKNVTFSVIPLFEHTVLSTLCFNFLLIPPQVKICGLRGLTLIIPLPISFKAMASFHLTCFNQVTLLSSFRQHFYFVWLLDHKLVVTVDPVEMALTPTPHPPYPIPCPHSSTPLRSLSPSPS